MNSANHISRVTSPSGSITLPPGVNALLFGTKPDQSSAFSNRSGSRYVHQQSADALRFDPCLRLKIEKLESALRFLGLEPTSEQQAEMRHRLTVDRDDTVAYRDFVALAEEMFKIDLPKINFSVPSARSETAQNLSYVGSQSLNSPSLEAELKSVCRERDKAKVENSRLQAVLHQKDLVLRSAEDELLRVREELQNAVEECRSLRSRLRLADEAQKAARRTEEDYEEVLRMLETELLQARQQDVQKKMPDDHARLRELEYHLRKAELDRKMYEVATERLLQFTTTVGENLPGVLRTISKEVEAINKRSGDHLNHMLPRSSQSIEMLAAEARSTTKAVRSLLEMESTSNGLDETNAEGQKLHSTSTPNTRTLKHQPQVYLESSAPGSFTRQGKAKAHLPKRKNESDSQTQL